MPFLVCASPSCRHQSGGFSPTLVSHVMLTWSHLQRFYFQIHSHSQVPKISQSVFWWTRAPTPVQALTDFRWDYRCCWSPLLGVRKASSWTFPSPSPVLAPYLHPRTCSWPELQLAATLGQAQEEPLKSEEVLIGEERERELCFWDCKFKSWFLWFAATSRLNKKSP